MKIREQREMQLYHILKVINKDIDFYNDRSEIVYQAIKDNCSTTQLNQIFIQLAANLDPYDIRYNRRYHMVCNQRPWSKIHKCHSYTNTRYYYCNNYRI